MGAFRGLNAHLPYLIVYLNDNRVIFAVNCHQFINIINVHVIRIFLSLGGFTVLSRKIFRRTLSFDTVYTYIYFPSAHSLYFKYKMKGVQKWLSKVSQEFKPKRK